MVRYLAALLFIYLKQDIMETGTTIKFPFRDELIKLIQMELPLHSVYVIGMETTKKRQKVFLYPLPVMPQETVTYTLLVVGHRSPAKNLGDFMGSLYGKMKGRCRVYVIFRTLSNVLKRLDIGDNFLNRIVSGTPCIFKENNLVTESCPVGMCLHSTYYERIRESWIDRMERAEYLLSVVGIIGEREDTASKMAVMHFAMEQVCLGLLRIFWEYVPNHYSLSYLFHLCGHFTGLPQRIFPRGTYGLQRQFYMLCNAHHIMRFKGAIQFSPDDSDRVFRRCERFFMEARGLGEKHLDVLKALHCRSFQMK